MEAINLEKIIKEYNDYAKSGAIIFDIAKDIIEKNDIVIIDMKNVDSVPTTFMNTSFGALIELYGIEKIKKSFKFRNILKTQAERIRKYFNDYQNIIEKRQRAVK